MRWLIAKYRLFDNEKYFYYRSDTDELHRVVGASVLRDAEGHPIGFDEKDRAARFCFNLLQNHSILVTHNGDFPRIVHHGPYAECRDFLKFLRTQPSYADCTITLVGPVEVYS